MVDSTGIQSPLVVGDTQAQVRKKVAMDEVRRSLADAAKSGDDSKLRAATQGFEAIFINKMWQEMRKSVPQEGYLHSREESTYRSMFERQMATKMAESGGMGLGDMLYQQLRQQLVDSASGSRTRTLPTDINTPEQGISVEANKPEIKDLADVHRAKSLKEAGMVLRNAAERSLGPAESGNEMPVSMEPNFNPLADTDPNVTAAASAPPEIMNRAMNLAARIEMERTRAQAMAVVKGSTDKAPAGGPAQEELHWPVNGKVAESYGWRKDPDTGERSWKPGVEIAAASGSPVEAGWDGIVAYVGERQGSGMTVVVEHGDGWRSIYGQAGETKVAVGDKVKAGSILAELEETGTDAPARLYFEIRKGDQAWNPESIRERRQDVAFAQHP